MQDTIEIRAYAVSRAGDVAWASPSHLEARAEFATLAEAQAFAALWPKGVRASAHTVSGVDAVAAGVSVRLAFRPNGTTGEVNEASVKRYAQLLKAASRLGVSVEYVAGSAINAYATLADFEANLPVPVR